MLACFTLGQDLQTSRFSTPTWADNHHPKPHLKCIIQLNHFLYELRNGLQRTLFNTPLDVDL